MREKNERKESFSSLESIIQKDYSNTVGIVVLKNGSKVYENYFNDCNATNHIHVFSVTKSIISMLFGIAMDKGYLTDLNRNVLDFFPDYQVNPREKTLQHITLKDMLTMTAPYKFKFNPYPKYFSSPDWVKFSLDLLGGKGKSGTFQYAPLIGPDILSAVLVKVTGQSVLSFAQENLFEPLGIHIENNISFKNKEEQMAFYKSTKENGWVIDPKGIHTAGWGLTLSAMDMAKLGQLYLNEGIWENKQLISKQWILTSTSSKSYWNKAKLNYGYLWWVIDAKEHSFAALGDGGNTLYVNPEKKLVVSITSLFVPRTKDRIDFIKEVIEPLFS